jgi:cytidylate kinase
MTLVHPAVVAITGPIGSGKTTTAALLARQLAWPKAGYGDTIRAIAAGRGLPASRENLQRLGLDQISSGWDAFTGLVLQHARWIPGQALILDGLRHPPAAAALRTAVAAHATDLALPAVRDHTGLVIAAERLTPSQVTGPDRQLPESALGHAPGGRCA